MPLRRYFLDQEDLNFLYALSSVPQGYVPGADPVLDKTLLAKTNAAWKRLGRRKGFDWTTVQPTTDETVILAKPLSENN